MKFTFSWLKEHLDTTATTDEISEKLTSLGLEVDSVVNPAKELQDFIIAHVLSAEPHPDANKLKVCQVSTGSETLQIVCGASNARSDMKVVLARAGTKIPSNGMVLKNTTIRGVESSGMMCSAQELGLEDASDGIMDLDEEAPVGEPYALYAGLNDPVFDLEITPNRGDCLGIHGIARDLAATGIGKLKPYEVPDLTQTGPCPLKVTFDFPEDKKHACPLFTGRLIKNVKNGRSPEWLQRKLLAVGLRPISALVDITNYMTMTHCRPMHVFDLSKLSGDTLTLRFAKDDEKILALDEKEYHLQDSMTVIADDSGPISLAGIMGGEATGCDESTTDVFLESAFFDPITTALTGRKLGIHSDSRFRFERGVDPAIVSEALDIATQMILDICGGSATETVITGQTPQSNTRIFFDPKRVKTVGGITTSLGKIEAILTTLGFHIEEEGSGFMVSVPSWRFDMDCEASLVEEVCRVIGYDHIEECHLPPATLDDFFESQPGSLQNQKRRNIARRSLASRGLCECNTWSFLDQKKADLFGGAEDALRLSNPLSKELEIMRPSLLANLVAGAGRNKDRALSNTALFEVGAAYHTSYPQKQEMRIAGVRTDSHAPRHWLNKERSVDLYDAKADLLSTLESCGINTDKIQIKSKAPSFFHPGRSGTIYQGPKNILGVFGELHPQVLEDIDVEGTVVGFELYLDRLPITKESHKKKLLKLSTLQPIHRDFAFLLDKDVATEKLLQAAKKVDKKLITEANIFDVYEGKGIPEGKKSIALTVTFEPFDKTLTDDEINKIMDQIIIAVGSETGGELRA